MKKSDFQVYVSPANEESDYKNVPIQLLDAFKRVFSDTNYKIRYRGPRMATCRQDGRWPWQAQRDCLKKRAEYFSAYRVGPVSSSHDTNKINVLSLEIAELKQLIDEKDKKINELEEKLAADYILQLENDLNCARDRIFELEEALGQIQDLASRVL